MVEDYLLILAGLSCSFAIIAYLIKFLRIYRRVQVNCWFCNKNTTVQYRFSNSFVCPFCEQYNGFKEDGDYNCLIPGQHSEQYKYSKKLFAKPDLSKGVDSKFQNGFCESCNLNQALKIRALAEFSSVSSDDNDEVEKFRERLEEIYGLCKPCQAILNQTLGKQHSWLKPLLISWRILKSKERLLNVTSRKSLKASVRKYADVFSLFICFLICLVSVEKYVTGMPLIYKENFSKKFVSTGSLYLTLLCGGTVLQFISVILLPKFQVNRIVGFIGWIAILSVEKYDKLMNIQDSTYLKFVLNLVNLFIILWTTGKTMQSQALVSKTDISSAKKLSKSAIDSSFTSSPITKVNDFTVKEESSSSGNDSFEEHFSVKSNLSKQQDLDAELLSLKISTPKKVDSSNFSPQNLFKGSPNYKLKTGSNGNVLQPSKFGKHFITQSSWVAGGYWGSPGSPQRGRLTRQNVSYLEEVKPKQLFSLSRSSSQSSGFVSQFSECASSRSQNIFQALPKQPQSQQSSLSGEHVERSSVYSPGRVCTSGSSISSPKSPHLESLEAQSACSASSYYSDTSHLRRRPPSRSSSCCHDGGLINYVNDLDVCTRHQNVNGERAITSSSTPNYFNLGIAFVLGISVSANLFLILMLWHYDVLGK